MLCITIGMQNKCDFTLVVWIENLYLSHCCPFALPVGSMLFMDDEDISVVEEKTLAKDSKQGSCMVLENEKWSDLPLDLPMLITESLSLAHYFHVFYLQVMAKGCPFSLVSSNTITFIHRR